jgi:cytochrome c551/c552
MKQVISELVKLMRHGLIVFVFLGFVPAVIAAQADNATVDKKYLSSSACQTCHPVIIDQHAQSHHAKSFTDPVFQGQYFKELLPKAEKDPMLLQEARACIACHSPVDSINLKGNEILKDEVSPAPELSGVTCDF